MSVQFLRLLMLVGVGLGRDQARPEQPSLDPCPEYCSRREPGPLGVKSLCLCSSRRDVCCSGAVCLLGAPWQNILPRRRLACSAFCIPVSLSTPSFYLFFSFPLSSSSCGANCAHKGRDNFITVAQICRLVVLKASSLWSAAGFMLVAHRRWASEFKI